MFFGMHWNFRKIIINVNLCINFRKKWCFPREPFSQIWAFSIHIGHLIDPNLETNGCSKIAEIGSFFTKNIALFYQNQYFFGKTMQHKVPSWVLGWSYRHRHQKWNLKVGYILILFGNCVFRSSEAHNFAM